MNAITLIAVGKNKAKSPFYELWNQYVKRMSSKVTLYEIEARSTQEEHQKILEKINPSYPLICLDEQGKSFSSQDFSKQLQRFQLDGASHIQFVIGGADGLSQEIRSKANVVMSFGQQTWPHMMVRVMLIEQIYRAQQILAGHPYHRE